MDHAPTLAKEERDRLEALLTAGPDQRGEDWKTALAVAAVLTIPRLLARLDALEKSPWAPAADAEALAGEIMMRLGEDMSEFEAAGLIESFCDRRAAEAASPAAGWKLVPVEPTKEMVAAGDAELENCKDGGWDSGPDGESHNSYEYIIPGAQSKIYRAMIASAPSPSEEARAG